MFEMKYLIIVIGFVYFGIGIDQYFKGSLPNAIIYSGYAFSNVGLFLLAKQLTDESVRTKPRKRS